MASELRRIRTVLRRVLVGALVLAVVALAAAVTAVARPEALGGSTPAQASAQSAPPERSHPQVVEPEAGVADAPEPTTPASSSDARAISDDEIRRELRQL